MRMSAQQLETAMRPLRTALDSALESLEHDTPVIRTQPVPRIAANPDGSGSQWVEQEFDPSSLVRALMPQLQAHGQLPTAELLLARELDTEPGRPDARGGWSPQRALIEVFLEEYLREALSPPDDSPFSDPTDIAFRTQVARLHALLSAAELRAQLIVLSGPVSVEPDEVQLAPTVALVPFTEQMRDELWRIAGWGSIAPQPLQSHEIRDVSHVISVELTGGVLAPWEWPDAYEKASRARQALILAGATSAAPGIAWLRHPDEFAAYLSRLRVGAGVVVRPLNTAFAVCSTLNAAATSQLPSLYAALLSPPTDPALVLALRRCFTASERASAEDRLIDDWIAFEALFAADANTELSFRASLRIACYLGASRHEREELRAGLKKAYEWRSKLVHGSDPQTAKLSKVGTLEDAVALCESTLRAVLAKAILAGSPPDLETLDNTFLA